MKKIFGLALLCAVVFACKDDADEVPTVRTLFKMNVASDIDLDNMRAWVIVRNSETGELIDYKEVLAGKTLTFTDTIQVGGSGPEKIDVAYFTFDPDPRLDDPSKTDNKYYTTVYPGIDIGAEWNARTGKRIDNTDPVQAGYYHLYLSSMPDYYGIGRSDNTGGNLQYDQEGPVFNDNVNFYTGKTKQMISIDPVDDKPKYIYVNDITSGAEKFFDYSQFESFDKYVTFETPEEVEIQAVVTGYDSNPIAEDGSYNYKTGFLTYNNVCWADAFDDFGFNLKRKKIELGFLNEFNYYQVYLLDSHYTYLSFGPAPTSISYVDHNQFKVTNGTLENFSTTASHDYVRRTVWFYYNEPFGPPVRDFVKTTYISGTDPVKLYQPIPDELIEEFSIPVDKMALGNVTFHTEGASFSDLLKRDKSADSGLSFATNTPSVESSVTVY